ncbi:MAG: hypothetical protein IPL61_16880 [Myxococcales bacterium]|nr:hypothetical protein [Myxococcales bacterium]
MNPRLLFVASAATLLACGDTGTVNTSTRSFDHPVDVAFGCVGRMKVLATGEEKLTPMPLRACAARAIGDPAAVDAANPTMPGQEAILNDNQFWYALAVQPTNGTVTVANAKLLGVADGLTPEEPPEYQAGAFAVEDSDPLIPGHNALTVGSSPLAIATDTAGCHVLTANAGTCDLSVIELERVRLKDETPIVTALPITAGGQPLRARPAALAAVDLDSPVGVECPATPVGIHYVSYPDCHAVAAVDGATGAVVASIRFAADGTATIGGGDLTCPRQCGERDPIVDGARPIALDIIRDDRVGLQKMAIGLANRPVVTVVTLTAAGLPDSVQQVDLEGDVGVIDVAISKQITMGGVTGGLDDGTGDGDEAQFVYAVATDGTVRVTEVLVAEQECDTQVDPRYLLDIRDGSRFICLGVGQVGTPPRRALARGPGVEFSSAARPVAVAIGTNNNKRTGDASPTVLAGHFAYVALSSGATAVVNIDDDNYADFGVASDVLGSQLPLAMPHQIRDGIGERAVNAVRGAGSVYEGTRNCAATGPDSQASSSVFVGGPRVDTTPQRVVQTSSIAETKAHVLPFFHQDECIDTSPEASTRPVSDLAFPVLDTIRNEAFPDWRAVPAEEDWTFTWEGRLSLDRTDGTNVVDGPQVRSGIVDIGGGGISVVDGAAPYCAAGVEPRDIVTLLGCDPARGDAQCGLNETCYVHPDATVATGACLPKDRAAELGGLCRDYLVSLRQFAVQDAFAGRLTLRERTRELRTTPLSGCTSDQQCQDLARYDAQLVSSAQPEDDTTAAPAFTYACRPDPFRTTAVNRCVMTCASDDQCAAGTLCRAGRCIEGVVPAPECAAGAQRYDLRGADALVAIGGRSGFLHPIVAEAGTGRCVKDPTAHPLVVGRIPLSVPPCAGDGPTDLAPNPCSLTVDQTERVADYVPGTCTLTTTGSKVVHRSAAAIRFRNPVFNLTLVDPTYPGDVMCHQDRAGALTDIPTVFPGFILRFHLTAGFQPQFMGEVVAQPANVVRAPDRSVWVVDAGDYVSDSVSIRGQLVRVSPQKPTSSITLR